MVSRAPQELWGYIAGFKKHHAMDPIHTRMPPNGGTSPGLNQKTSSYQPIRPGLDFRPTPSHSLSVLVRRPETKLMQSCYRLLRLVKSQIYGVI